MNIPAPLKSLTAYIRRAEELDRDGSPTSKIVAYHCKTFAMEKGLKLRGAETNTEIDEFLIILMNGLERDKPNLGAPAEERRMICFQFAYDVFSKADDIDRSGLADKSTAKMFYAAGTFFDILEQFGEFDSDVLEKRRYSKFKAADIINSINNGLKPSPGPAVEHTLVEQDISSAPVTEPLFPPVQSLQLGGGVSSSRPSSAAAVTQMHLIPPSAPDSMPTILPRAPFAAQQPPTVFAASTQQTSASISLYKQDIDNDSNAHMPMHTQYAPAAAPHYNLPPSQAPSYNIPSVSGMPMTTSGASRSLAGSSSAASLPSDPKLKDALELCSFAMAAIKHNDVHLARERLQEALRRLG